MEDGKVRTVEIGPEEEGQRLDNYLLRILKGVPKSRIYRLIRKGEVRVNSARSRAATRLAAGDRVRIPPVRISASPKAPTASTFCPDILYEDDRLLVVNKPSGLAVHGGSGVSFGLIEHLRVARPDDHFLELVHRLDRGTSGCLMLAKKRSYLRTLHGYLRDHRIQKTYLALVVGRWPKRKTVLDQSITRNVLRSGERVSQVDIRGKAARTTIQVREYLKDFTLIQAIPATGRTHQIRVHTEAAGHPIVGDTRYGDRQVNRLMRKKGLSRLLLHAERVLIPADDDSSIEILAPLDSATENIINQLDKAYV